MMTLRLFSHRFATVPASTSWYLADLGEARGKQQLFTRQSPQRLKALREHALIESAVSSNRIEGVEVDPSRIATIVFGRSLLRDRDEEEVRGYRQALTWIHEQGEIIPKMSAIRIETGHKPDKQDMGLSAEEPVKDPAPHPVARGHQVAHYWLKVSSMKRQMIMRENSAPYGRRKQ